MHALHTVTGKYQKISMHARQFHACNVFELAVSHKEIKAQHAEKICEGSDNQTFKTTSVHLTITARNKMPGH